MQTKYCTVSFLLKFLAAKFQRKTKTTDFNDVSARGVFMKISNTYDGAFFLQKYVMSLIC